MNRLNHFAGCMAIAVAACSCSNKTADANPEDFDYVVDRFADIEVLRYQVPEFDSLSLQQKLLVYHLTEAAIAGRDILWDQNGKYNLAVRDMMENIYLNYNGSKDSDEYKAFEKYLKQIWFANGLHHHYSMDKFTPQFSKEFLIEQINALPDDKKPKDQDTLIALIFDPSVSHKNVNQA